MVKFIVWISLVRQEKVIRIIVFYDALCLFLGRQLVVVNSNNLLSELCDDKRFPKLVSGAVKEISVLVHDGLFTYADCTPSQPH